MSGPSVNLTSPLIDNQRRHPPPLQSRETRQDRCFNRSSYIAGHRTVLNLIRSNGPYLVNLHTQMLWHHEIRDWAIGLNIFGR